MISDVNRDFLDKVLELKLLLEGDSRSEELKPLLESIRELEGLDSPELVYRQHLLARYGMGILDYDGIPPEVFDLPVIDKKLVKPGERGLQLSRGTWNRFVGDYGMCHIGYLVIRSEEELRRIPSAGNKCINELKGELASVHPNLRIDMPISYIHPNDIEGARAAAKSQIELQPDPSLWNFGRTGQYPYVPLEVLADNRKLSRRYMELLRIHPALHAKNYALLSN